MASLRKSRLRSAHSSSIFPGADDNASGVAGLLELARHFGKHPPKVRVELVGYPNEEPPHFTIDDMGSVQHARALKQRGAQVVAAISLEMLGTSRMNRTASSSRCRR